MVWSDDSLKDLFTTVLPSHLCVRRPCLEKELIKTFHNTRKILWHQRKLWHAENSINLIPKHVNISYWHLKKKCYVFLTGIGMSVEIDMNILIKVNFNLKECIWEKLQYITNSKHACSKKTSKMVNFQLVPQLVTVCILTEENPNSNTKVC